MIKVLYSGYMVRDMCSNYHEYSIVGKAPEYVKGYFCLCDDDIETLNDFGSVKISSVIGERLDEYDMLIYEEGDDLPLVQYSGCFTDSQGIETPFEIIKGENTYSQGNGNRLKIFFDDDTQQTNLEPPINSPADNFEQQLNQTKSRRKLMPLERETENLLLIYEMTRHYKVQCLSDLDGIRAWSMIVSGDFQSDLIKTIEGNKTLIVLNSGKKIKKSDFLEIYRKRFKETQEAV